MKLQDQKLFRQQCYIDGEWVDAYDRATIPVTRRSRVEPCHSSAALGEPMREDLPPASTIAAACAMGAMVERLRSDPGLWWPTCDVDPVGRL